MSKQLLSLIFILYCHHFSSAQNYLANFSQVEVASGISNATAMAFAPDGRIFVTQQNGVVHVIKNGVKLATPAISLPVNSSGERGLMGIALHPSFSTNGIIYLHYTLPDGSRNRISRFWLNGDALNPQSEQIIYNMDPLGASTNHNGGGMMFHNDRLYIGVGDNANSANAQNLNSTHGKILRINANGSFPGDNIVYPGPVWAYGLRNPYTLDIDPVSGRIFVNDVGENNWEEINDATVKRNFGWPATEGNTTNPSYTSPVYAYGHGNEDGKGCAISGGAFFNPATTSYPVSFKGKYFYQDLCSNWINYLDLTGSTPTRHAFATGLPGQSLGLKTGTDGNLYFLSRSTGKLYKIVYNNTQAPVITAQPQGDSVNQYGAITFSVESTGGQPITYQWRKNGSNIAGANARTLTLNNLQPSQGGTYTVVLTNAYGSTTSAAAVLFVQENRPPVVTIYRNPVPDFDRYRAGQLKWFEGQAIDPDEGYLPVREFRSNWYETGFLFQVLYFKNGVLQQSNDVSNQRDVYFIIPPESDPSPNAFYRVVLTVTDSHGLSGRDSVDIYPYTSQFTLQTSPPGLHLLLDGNQVQTPHTETGVEGTLRTVKASSTQSAGANHYTFDEWNNGSNEAEVTFTTPVNDTTITAYYTQNNSGWRSADIGPVAIPGYVEIDGNNFIVHASGNDIWENADQFHYVYQPINGNADIRVRVAGFQNTVHSWAKAGLMIRETLQPNAKHAMNVITPSQGISFQRRTQTGGSTIATGTTGKAPHWLRLVRDGNTFTAYTSENGVSWTQTASQTFTMSTNAYVGLVLSSHSTNTLSAVTMTDVTLAVPVSGASFGETLSITRTEGVDIYPNPVVGDALHVKLNHGASFPLKLELVNSLGQVVLEKEFQTGDDNSVVSVEIGNVASGMYILKASTGERKVTAPIIRK